MLQQTSSYSLGEIGEPLRLAAERHGASILAVSDLGKLLREQGVKATHDATVVTLCFPELYSALLAADIRFAAFLPCRIAVCDRGEGVTIEALSALEFCRLLHRADLDRLVLPLETALREILDELHQHPAHPHAARHTGRFYLGATENQMNVRGSLAQRIDCKGTKIEDLAGTGQHDAAGG